MGASILPPEVCAKSKRVAHGDPWLISNPQLQGRFDLEAPSLKQWLRDVLRVFVPPRPLAQAGGPQVLVGGELILANDLFEFGDRRSHRPDRLGLAPVGISASLCHGEEDPF